MTTNEIKIPKIVYNPESWSDLKPRGEIGDNLYAIHLRESSGGWGNHSKRNIFLYHHPNQIAYSLTNNDFSYTFEKDHEKTFCPEEIKDIEDFIHSGKEAGYKGVELRGYDSKHPLVEKLVFMNREDKMTKNSLERAKKKVRGLIKKLTNSKKNLIEEFLPEGNFNLRN